MAIKQISVNNHHNTLEHYGRMRYTLKIFLVGLVIGLTVMKA
jgi:hypothetical protein